jgi:hypothetical protein
LELVFKLFSTNLLVTKLRGELNLTLCATKLLLELHVAVSQLKVTSLETGYLLDQIRDLGIYRHASLITVTAAVSIVLAGSVPVAGLAVVAVRDGMPLAASDILVTGAHFDLI